MVMECQSNLGSLRHATTQNVQTHVDNGNTLCNLKLYVIAVYGLSIDCNHVQFQIAQSITVVYICLNILCRGMPK